MVQSKFNIVDLAGSSAISNLLTQITSIDLTSTSRRFFLLGPSSIIESSSTFQTSNFFSASVCDKAFKFWPKRNNFVPHYSLSGLNIN